MSEVKSSDGYVSPMTKAEAGSKGGKENGRRRKEAANKFLDALDKFLMSKSKRYLATRVTELAFENVRLKKRLRKAQP